MEDNAVGIIYSESAPSPDNRYVWVKPSTGEHYVLNSIGDGWVLHHIEVPASTQIETHTANPDAHHLEHSGVTGEVTVANKLFTFENGLLKTVKQLGE